MEKRAGAAGCGRGNRPSRGNSHVVLTFFWIFLDIGLLCLCHEHSRRLQKYSQGTGGEIGAGQAPERGRGGGFCSGWLLAPVRAST